ncbi:MAG: AAA family ATPase [Clostridiaceae bacterium]|nr:AAA family ATPase [Clostridiaceae bacterium]
MHIDSIEIKGFGKLKNRVLSFGKGMNVVFGANEAGKSTMQSFIRAMFYGLKGGKRSVSGLPSPQKRFMPWDGEPYGGAVAYTLDAGASYRIERDFSRNSVVVYDTAYNDITSSFNFSRDRQPMVGETHLGLDEVTFENTVFIRQMGVRLDSTGSSVLAARLVNVDDPDIDGLTFQRAEAALIDALKNRVGTERSRVQPLDRLQSELRRLESEHGTLAGRQKEKEKLMRELSEIKDRIRHFETQEQLLVKIGELIETRKKIDEGMKREARLSETAKQLGEIETALAKLYSHDAPGGAILQPEQGNADPDRILPGKSIPDRPLSGKPMPVRTVLRISLLALCAVAALISGVLLLAPVGSISGMVPIPPYVYAAVMPVCVLTAVKLTRDMLAERKNFDADEKTVGPGGKDAAGLNGTAARDGADKDGTAGEGTAPGDIVTSGDAGEKLAALKSVKRNLLSGVSVMCGIKAECISDVRAALDGVRSNLERLSQQLQDGLDEAAGMDIPLPGSFSKGELDVLIYDSDTGWLEKEWKTETECLRRQILDAALREKYCEGQLDDDKGEVDKLQRVEEEIAAVKEKIARLEETGKALKLASEVLAEAAEKIRLNNAPELNSRMSVIISGLTGGRYTDLRGDDRLLLKASDPQEGDVRSVSALSSGTADQMYLALRLATAGILTSGGESLPLVMDEVFSQFDDKRTELALKYLYSEHRSRQILLFTCKMREVELVREIYGNEMYFVEL